MTKSKDSPEVYDINHGCIQCSSRKSWDSRGLSLTPEPHPNTALDKVNPLITAALPDGIRGSARPMVQFEASWKSRCLVTVLGRSMCTSGRGWVGLVSKGVRADGLCQVDPAAYCPAPT